MYMQKLQWPCKNLAVLKLFDLKLSGLICSMEGTKLLRVAKSVYSATK